MNDHYELVILEERGRRGTEYMDGHGKQNGRHVICIQFLKIPFCQPWICVTLMIVINWLGSIPILVFVMLGILSS